VERGSVIPQCPWRVLCHEPADDQQHSLHMRISNSEISVDQDRAILHATCAYGGRTETLWYSVERRYLEYLDQDTQDAFVLGTMLIAMRLGEDIHVEGSISERLYYNLSHYVVPILRLLLPDLHSVAIIPAHLQPDNHLYDTEGVATSFSGGIDSFSCLVDHLFGNVPKAYRITHLVMNNTGSHGNNGHVLFRKRCRRLAVLASELNLQFVAIDSNLHNLLVNWNHQETSTVRDISAAMILPGLYRRYYYPSSYDYGSCYIGPTYSMGYSEPTLLPLLATGSTEFIPTGSQYSRVEKTLQVTAVPLSYEYLDVCTDARDRESSRNCSICNKCLRTLVTLEVLGKLRLYDKVFDIDTYRRYRKWYLAQVFLGVDPFAVEIGKLAKERKYQLHRFPWFLKMAYPLIKPRGMPGCVPESMRTNIKALMRKMGCYRW